MSVGDKGSKIRDNDIYKGRVVLVLVFFSELYSELDLISVGVSKPSSCSTSHHILTTYTTNYCPNKIVYDFDLRRLFYTR